MEINDLLSTLQGEGSLDSRGRFTLDPELMLAKLARYRFADPHAYLLCLVAGLAVQGARRVVVVSQAQSLHLSAECRPLSADQLRNLLEELVNPSPSAVNHELALGLYAAARQHQSVEMLSRDGSQELSWRLRGLDGQLAIAPAAAPGTGLEVRLTSKSWLAVAKNALRPTSRERIATLLRLRYAPYEVVFNETTLNQEFDLSACPVTACVGELGSQVCQQRRDGPLRALVGLGADKPGLLAMVHGVLYPCAEELPYQSLCLVEANGLRADLSQAHVVVDERYQTMLADLHRELEKTLLENVRRVPPGSGTSQQQWLKEMLARPDHAVPEELQVLELLRDTRGQKKPVKVALKQQQTYGCVLVGKAGMATTYYGRFVLYRHPDLGWLLDALPIEVVELARTDDGKVVPGRITLRQTVDLPDPQPELYFALERFVCGVGRGAAGIPRTTCSLAPHLTLYSAGVLTSGKAPLLPPGLELVLDRPDSGATAPTAVELGPQLAPLYRALLDQLDQPEALTYVLGWLAAVARCFNTLRRNLMAVEALGPVGQQLLPLSPAQALLRPDDLPDLVQAQLEKTAQAVDLKTFARAPLVPTRAGRRTVWELMEGTWRYGEGSSEPDCLQLNVAQAALLGELVGSGRLKRV